MVKLLLVSTSAGSMGGNPTGLWLAELAEPWFVFKAAGYELVLASPAGGAIPVDCGSVKGDFFTEDAKKFMHDPEALDALFHSVKLDTVDLSEFDGMFIAGGHGCCVDGSAMKTAIETLYNAKKLVCADCHGPYALIDCVKEDGTPLVQGLAVTAFTNLEEEQAGATEWVAGNAKFMETVFKEQGAVFENADPWNSHVTVAGNLVTCQNPQSALAGAKKCVEILSA
jgi:putative intracellular protease/amidase